MSRTLSVRNTLLGLLSVQFACLVQTTAYAAAKAGDHFGDWTYECSTLANKKTVCAITQIVTNEKNKRPILKLSLAQNDAKAQPVLVALMPLGIRIPAGVSGSVDQGKPFPLTVQTCTPRGCIASTPVSAARKRQFNPALDDCTKPTNRLL